MAWPRWAVDLARKALAWSGLFPAARFQLDLEIHSRDVVEFLQVEDNEAPGWPCAGPEGWQ